MEMESVMDEGDGDEKDDVKRKSRNLSEKKRRDQFNLLINELSVMVASNNRKMDKSTVLKATISFLKNQKEMSTRSQSQEVREDWKPSFLSNEEFTHLMLEALDGFIMTVSCSGRVLYTSESITPLLGHLPGDLSETHVYDLMLSEEKNDMRRFLSNPALAPNPSIIMDDTKEQYAIAVHLKRSPTNISEEPSYERVKLTGYFERYTCPSEDGVLDFSCSEAEDSMSVGSSMVINNRQNTNLGGIFGMSPSQSGVQDTKLVFVAIGRMERPQLVREMMILEPTKTEFTSRHSLEWKFLFLDHRAPTIIGYLPFEVLGTSGYDYYHVDDLEKVSICHERLMKTGKGTSCYYRFLTKGQQWIWLQTQYYITYHQWNSKPEFIVCTNTVVGYSAVKGQLVKEENGEDLFEDDENDPLELNRGSSMYSAGPSGVRMGPMDPDNRSLCSGTGGNSSDDNRSLSSMAHSVGPGLTMIKSSVNQTESESDRDLLSSDSDGRHSRSLQDILPSSLRQQQLQTLSQRQHQQIQQQQIQNQKRLQQEQEQRQHQHQQAPQPRLTDTDEAIQNHQVQTLAEQQLQQVRALQQKHEQQQQQQAALHQQQQEQLLQQQFVKQPPPPQPQQPQQPQQSQLHLQLPDQQVSPTSPSSSQQRQQPHSPYPQPPHHLPSRGEPPPWSPKARPGSSTSSYSDRSAAKRLRIQQQQQQQQQRQQQQQHQQQQQQQQSPQVYLDDMASLPSPGSDISVNSHNSQTSHSSLQSHGSQHGSLQQTPDKSRIPQRDYQANSTHNLEDTHEQVRLYIPKQFKYGSRTPIFKTGNIDNEASPYTTKAKHKKYYRKIELPPEISSRLAYKKEEVEDQLMGSMVNSPGSACSSYNSESASVSGMSIGNVMMSSGQGVMSSPQHPQQQQHHQQQHIHQQEQQQRQQEQQQRQQEQQQRQQEQQQRQQEQQQRQQEQQQRQQEQQQQISGMYGVVQQQQQQQQQQQYLGGALGGALGGGGSSGSGNIRGNAPNNSAAATQVLQVSTVPFSPVISIPGQPVMANLSVQLPQPQNTEDLRPQLILSPEQRQLQEQLRQKHAELQQMIMRQQQELQSVNEQLVMAQYGMYKNNLQYSATPSIGGSSSSTGGFPGAVNVSPGSIGAMGALQTVGPGSGGSSLHTNNNPGSATVTLGNASTVALGPSAVAQSTFIQSSSTSTGSSLQHNLQPTTITVASINPRQVSVVSGGQHMAVPSIPLSHQQASMLFAQPVPGTAQPPPQLPPKK